MEKGYAVLDKTKFEKSIDIKALVVKQEQVGKFLKHKKTYLHPKMQVAKDQFPEQGYKYILLKPDILGNYNYNIIDQEIEELLKKTEISDIKQSSYNLKQTLEDLSMSEILREIIPKEIKQVPSAYELVGSVAHMNLRPALLPYKYIIGELILLKNKQIKTVCNKTESLANEFRTPVLEIIGGVDSYETEVKENNIKFKLNYQKVYWNSRLQQERLRMLSKFKKGETLCDMFCGIGPLALQAVQHGLQVIANDLNPDCFHYLQMNASDNHIPADQLECFNLDARTFLNTVINPTKYTNKHNYLFNNRQQLNVFQHVYMNLPGDAVLFLDVFQGFLHKADKSIWNEHNLPLLHVYTFSQGDTIHQAKQLVLYRVLQVLSAFSHQDVREFVHVRDISTHKKMYCLTFQLSPAIALQDPINKKLKQ